jgi:hypothetical protein
MSDPKEKAEELVDLYCQLLSIRDYENKEKAKQCALLAIDFAMNSEYSFQPLNGGWVSGKKYYEELKQEIEKL